jgi:hypothetical protein
MRPGKVVVLSTLTIVALAFISKKNKTAKGLTGLS